MLHTVSVRYDSFTFLPEVCMRMRVEIEIISSVKTDTPASTRRLVGAHRRVVNR